MGYYNNFNVIILYTLVHFILFQLTYSKSKYYNGFIRRNIFISESNHPGKKFYNQVFFFNCNVRGVIMSVQTVLLIL